MSPGGARAALRRALAAAPALALALLLPAGAAAQLASGFGGFGGSDGFVTVADPPFIDDAALQPDGKIVVAGGGSVARYGPDGALDASFGESGVAALPGLQGEALAVQPDGRIVVAGNVGSSWGVVRLFSNGDVQASFGSGGLATASFDGDAGDVQDVLLQPDGRIVVGGGSENDVALARFEADGSLDGGFGEGGEATLGLGAKGDEGNAIALQENGKILIAGEWDDTAIDTEPNDADTDFGLARFHADGTPDTSFHGDGKLKTGFGGAVEFARGMVVQEDGRIVAVGFKGTFGSNGRIVMARYEVDGSLDSSFGDGGKVVTDPTPDADDAAWDVVLQSDGRIVVAADVDVAGGGHGVLYRYGTEGSLDSTFGPGPQNDVAGFRTLLQQPDGKLLVSGADDTLRRYEPDGTPDDSGSVTTRFGELRDRAYDVAVQADGKILVAGEADPVGVNERQVALARYHPDGTPDESFGTDGRALGGIGDTDAGRAMVLTDSGAIRVAGFHRGPEGHDFAVYGFEPDGEPDDGFGFAGINFAPDFGCGGDDLGYGLAEQPDGKLVVAGQVPADVITGGCGDLQMGVARFGANGVLDEGFSGDGLASRDVASGPDSMSVARDVAVQSSGRIVLAGYGENDTGRFVGLHGLEPDGTVDLSGFGFQGDATTEVGAHSRAEAIALLPDDRIVVGGHTDRDDAGDFLLLRYSESGVLDESFGDGGVVTTDFGGDEAAYAVALQPDGKILAAGSEDSVLASSDLFLARYHADGEPDESFGEGGRRTLELPVDAAARGLALDGEGGALVTGVRESGRLDDDFLTARTPVAVPEPGARWLAAAALATLALLPAGARS